MSLGIFYSRFQDLSSLLFTCKFCLCPTIESLLDLLDLKSFGIGFASCFRLQCLQAAFKILFTDLAFVAQLRKLLFSRGSRFQVLQSLVVQGSLTVRI